jgi:hypothetical protein
MKSITLFSANVEKEKARLQSLMAYGKVTLPEPLVKPKPRSKQKKEHLPSLEERFQIGKLTKVPV